MPCGVLSLQLRNLRAALAFPAIFFGSIIASWHDISESAWRLKSQITKGAETTNPFLSSFCPLHLVLPSGKRWPAAHGALGGLGAAALTAFLFEACPTLTARLTTVASEDPLFQTAGVEDVGTLWQRSHAITRLELLLERQFSEVGARRILSHSYRPSGMANVDALC